MSESWLSKFQWQNLRIDHGCFNQHHGISYFWKIHGEVFEIWSAFLKRTTRQKILLEYFTWVATLKLQRGWQCLIPKKYSLFDFFYNFQTLPLYKYILSALFLSFSLKMETKFHPWKRNMLPVPNWKIYLIKYNWPTLINLKAFCAI